MVSKAAVIVLIIIAAILFFGQFNVDIDRRPATTRTEVRYVTTPAEAPCPERVSQSRRTVETEHSVSTVRQETASYGVSDLPAIPSPASVRIEQNVQITNNYGSVSAQQPAPAEVADYSQPPSYETVSQPPQQGVDYAASIDYEQRGVPQSKFRTVQNVDLTRLPSDDEREAVEGGYYAPQQRQFRSSKQTQIPGTRIYVSPNGATVAVDGPGFSAVVRTSNRDGHHGRHHFRH